MNCLLCFFMNRYYVSFLPFFRKIFTLEAAPKENCEWFCNWRSTHFCHTDSCFVLSTDLIRIQWLYNLYNIAWTNFISRQSFFGYKTCICWDSNVVIYRCTLLTKVVIKQVCFSQKTETSWLPANSRGISGILVPFTSVFSIFQ